MAAGRPSEYDYNLCIEICDKVADGMHIVDVLNSDKRYPVWSTFRVWKREHEELQTLYTRSTQDKAEMVVHEIEEIKRDLKEGNINAPEARVIMDANRWLASKYYPRMYGDKLDLSTNGEKINQTPNINLVLEGKPVDLSLSSVRKTEE